MMRHAREDRHGWRLRAIVVVLWRAGLRVQEALALSERDLDARRGSLLVRQGKADGAARSAWTIGAGNRYSPGSPPASSSRRPAVLHHRRADPRAAHVKRRRPPRVPPARRPGRSSGAASRRTSCGTPTPWSSPETVPGLGARRRRPASASSETEAARAGMREFAARANVYRSRLGDESSAHGRAAARRRDRQSRAGERCSPSHVRPVACPEATTRTTSVYRSLGVLRASAEIVGRRASLEPALVSVGSARANFAARVRQSLLSPGATQGPYARTSRPVESRHERSRPRGPTRADRAPCAAALPLTPERA